MTDTKTASLVLVAGAAGVAYWWWQLTRGALATPAPSSSPTPGPAGSPELSKGPQVATGDTLGRLQAFARRWGLTITSGYRPGDTHSLHSERRAIDVVTPPPALQKAIEAAAAALGIHILKEEYGPGGGPYRSTGPHWHLSVPELRNGKLVF